MPASEVYDEAGILTITPGSTNPQITERGMKDLFRMCGRDDQQGGDRRQLYAGRAEGEENRRHPR